MKILRSIVAVLASAALVSLTGCSLPELFGNDEYEYEYHYVQPESAEPQDTVTTDDIDELYDDQIEYIPEMFFGKYTADDTVGGTLKNPGKFIEGKTLNFNPTKDSMEGEKITYVPFRIEAGPHSNPTDLQQIPGHYWLKMYVCTQTGEVREMEASYTLSGRMILIRPINWKNTDPETGNLDYSLISDPLALRYTFKGTDLILTHGKDSVTLHAEDIYTGKGISVTDSNLTPGSESLFDVSSFSLYNDSGAIIENEETYPATVDFGEDGFCTLKWNNHRSKLVYFYCGDDGMVFSNGEKNYIYTSRSWDIYTPSISGNLSSNSDDKLSELTEEQINELVSRNEQLYTDLKEAFANAGIDANIIEDSGEIDLNSVVLFSFGQSDVSPEGREYISRFLQAYTSVIFSEKYDGFISQIMVEGHTDKSGSYDYNMKLSRNRASTVLEYCLSPESGLSPEIIEKLTPLLTSVGYSYDVPVLNEDGSVNNEASRRVAFRFMINVDAAQ